jgi:hypothetical protein
VDTEFYPPVEYEHSMDDIQQLLEEKQREIQASSEKILEFDAQARALWDDLKRYRPEVERRGSPATIEPLCLSFRAGSEALCAIRVLSVIAENLRGVVPPLADDAVALSTISRSIEGLSEIAQRMVFAAYASVCNAELATSNPAPCAQREELSEPVREPTSVPGTGALSTQDKDDS